MTPSRNAACKQGTKRMTATPAPGYPPHKLAVAPMMDCTDRHARYLLRLASPRAWLYTEMVTARALGHGDPARPLAFDPAEHPVVLQLGGSEPVRMAEAARLGELWGYDAVDINCGCPSERVKEGAFGACLMAEPETVAATVAAIRQRVSLPVSVKTRIGIDDRDDDAFLDAFADAVVASGARALTVHARKAWLKGLSPKENRNKPPLVYDRVYRLKARLGDFPVYINGGIETPEAVAGHLAHVDGVMVGRQAYNSPTSLARMEEAAFGDSPGLSDPVDLLAAYRPYVAARLAEGVPLKAMTQHLLGLFQGRPGARRWRRYLSENARHPESGLEVLDAALAELAPPRDAA